VAAHNPGVPPDRVDAGAVIARRVRSTDAGAIAAAVGASLDYLARWLPWATPDAATRPNQIARAAEADQRWEAGLAYTYSVLTAEHGTLVGEVALYRRDDGRCIELGYWVAASQAGRGFCTLACAALISVALALPGVSRAEIHCDAANGASAAVARKLGFRLDHIEAREPETSGETGRLMVWVRESESAGG
jgi:RimJ/RimL family protein N-acetyltransferase